MALSLKSLSQKIEKTVRWAVAAKPRWALVILTLLWLLPGNAHLPLVDRDEPRFAYATQEMVDRGDWWVPTFNEEYRFDKPPLVYWWMRAHYAVLGFNDFSARLHSVVATAMCVLLIYGFASRLYDKRIGFLSAFGFLTLLQVFLHGRLCVADMPMMIFIIAAQWAAWELLQKSSWRWAIIFWAALGLGFTTKWLVPIAAVGVPMVLYFIIKRQWPWRFVKNFKPFTGVAVMLGIILAWAVPAWMSTQWAFFKVGVGEHFFERGVAAFNARGYNPFFYIFTAFISLMPWLGLLGAAIVALRKNKESFGDREKFLVAWVVGVYILFSAAQTQLPHYVLPAFPSLIILIAALTGLRKPEGKWTGRIYTGVNIFWWVLLGLALLIVALLPAGGELLRVKLGALGLLLMLLSLTLLGWAFVRRRWLMTVVSFILVPMFFAGSAAAFYNLTPGQKVAAYLNRVNMPELRVATGFEEPSLISYTQAQWHTGGDYTAAKEMYDKAPSAALVVLSEEFTLESIPSILLQRPVLARRDNQKTLLANPPQGGRRFYFEGVHLGRFSWVRAQLYLKP